MTCPEPELCKLLQVHLHGRRWDIFCGTVLTPEKCERYRQYWCNQAEVDRESVDKFIPTRGIGDVIAKGLAAVGITKKRVSAVMGDCRCKERQDALNERFPL